MPALLHDSQALARLDASAITALTEAATRATFYTGDLTAEQQRANERIVAISAESCIGAAANEHQLFSAAFVDGAFAGYMIATRHAADDRELDWMMVHPERHGTGVARALMEAGIAFLGPNEPLWLNVIAANARAIAFYRKFRFEIDPHAHSAHIVPHLIMRRAKGR